MMIESETLTIKLLNGSTISIRPLTLKERRHCISLIPQDLEDPEKFTSAYMQFQRDVIHYIITRTNPSFKKEDVESLLDSSLIEKIIKFALKDPFKEFFGL